MINQWQPASSIDITLLSELVRLGEQALQQEIKLNQALSAAQSAQVQGWLRLDEQQWQDSIAQLELNQCFPLAVFFTLAEQQLSGWQCGENNPAIWLFRWLKKNHASPEKEQIRYLKSLTDNKFIPYGNALKSL